MIKFKINFVCLSIIAFYNKDNLHNIFGPLDIQKESLQAETNNIRFLH